MKRLWIVHRAYVRRLAGMGRAAEGRGAGDRRERLCRAARARQSQARRAGDGRSVRRTGVLGRPRARCRWRQASRERSRTSSPRRRMPMWRWSIIPATASRRAARTSLRPTDADLSTPQRAGETMVPLSDLLDQLAKTVPVTIVLLDACRTNAFAEGHGDCAAGIGRSAAGGGDRARRGEGTDAGGARPMPPPTISAW